jgi:hypothetical protein
MFSEAGQLRTLFVLFSRRTSLESRPGLKVVITKRKHIATEYGCYNFIDGHGGDRQNWSASLPPVLRPFFTRRSGCSPAAKIFKKYEFLGSNRTHAWIRFSMDLYGIKKCIKTPQNCDFHVKISENNRFDVIFYFYVTFKFCLF